MLSRLHNANTTFSRLTQTLSLVWAASGNWTIAWIGLLVIQGLLPVSTVYLTRTVVDSLVAIVGAGTGASGSNIQAVLLPVGLMALILLLNEFLQGASDWIRTAQSELVQDHINALIHRQSMTIDFGCYESSEYNDQLSRAREGAPERSLALLESTGSLLQNTITLLAMAAVLLPYGFWLPLMLGASALPTFSIMMRLNRLQYQWSQRTTTDRRRLQYYDLLLTNSVVAAELRLFNFGDSIQSSYRTLRRRLRKEQMRLIRNQSISRLGAGLLALIILGVALAWMGWQVLLGTVTLGDLALFYQAFSQGQGIVKSLLSNLGQVYRNSLFIGNLFEFLKLQPQITDPPTALVSLETTAAVPFNIRQEIQFRQVTFRYPGSEEAILKNFNLTIPADKIVAIVGDNGAGKSTLLKLLCRFYDPEQGSVEIDGVDLRNYPIAQLRKLITILFQFPITYQMTATQNIALGDLSTAASTAEIEAAAKNAGIHEKLTRLPQGYDSMLGKWFPGGTDLSGGEWQRLALARAFLRKAPVIVLDEPTSAMDPWAEFDWLERFRTMAEGRTAIVITHRFTLAMRADIIHVMRAGQIVESGSHDQLLVKDGLYAQSWRSQMQASQSPSQESSNLA